MPFTDETWDAAAVSASLEADEYCEVCLIDLNPAGDKKVKGSCKLPLRKSPGAPYNMAAIRNAMGRIFQMTEVPAEEKRKAARKLVQLAREAKITVASASLLRLAGMKSTE
jgi:hypothetical protein